jgi:hypothetical protein
MQPVSASPIRYNNKACIVISVQTYRLHSKSRRIRTQDALPRSTVIMEVGPAWLGNNAQAKEGTWRGHWFRRITLWVLDCPETFHFGARLRYKT